VVVGGDRSELAIAAASVIASVAHEASLVELAREWPLWDFGVNVGWPSRQHLRSIAIHGPAGCHRRCCFPFQRRHGKRMAFHPDRRIFADVQAELQRATLIVDGGARADSSARCDDGSDAAADGLTLARRQRYLDWYRASPSLAAEAEVGGSSSGATRTPFDATRPQAQRLAFGGKRRNRRARARRSSMEPQWTTPQTGGLSGANLSANGRTQV
jgi:hypothetical protein